MKAFKKSFVAFALAICLVLSLVSCELPLLSTSSSESSSPTNASYAYIAIDINPSIELVVADGIVTSVRACNDDAEVLLSGEDLSGISAEEATEKIVLLAEELGYINDENTDVNVTVTADDEQASADLEVKVKNGAKKGSSKAIVNSNPRVDDEREVEELKNENPELFKNLSPAKLRLIKSIMEYDEEMTIEIGITMNTDELLELLKTYADEFKGINGKELQKKVKERKEELKEQKEDAIAEIYGEDYLAIWNKISALKTIYKDIEAKAEAVEISAEDLASLNQLIVAFNEANKTEMLDELVSVKADELDDILNSILKQLKRLDGTSDELEALFEEIIEKYDEDAYALTADELALIAEAYGECEITTLEELESIIDDLKDQLNALKNEIVLDDAQKIAIDEAKERFDSAKEQIKDEFKSEIDQAREHFEQQKTDRHEMHNINR